LLLPIYVKTLFVATYIKNIFPIISVQIVVEQITNLFYNKLSSELLYFFSNSRAKL